MICESSERQISKLSKPRRQVQFQNICLIILFDWLKIQIQNLHLRNTWKKFDTGACPKRGNDYAKGQCPTILDDTQLSLGCTASRVPPPPRPVVLIKWWGADNVWQSLGWPGQEGTFLLADSRFEYYFGVKVRYTVNWNPLPRIILSLYTMCCARARFYFRSSINTNRVVQLLRFLYR